MRYLLLIVAVYSAPTFSITPVIDQAGWIQRQLKFVQSKLELAEIYLIKANTKVNNYLLVNNLRNNIKQLKRLERQIKQMDRQYKALAGKRGYGRWLKGPARLLDPSLKPKTREEWIETLSGGREYAGIRKRRIRPTTVIGKQNEAEEVATIAASETSANSYREVSKMLKRNSQLMEEMDNAETLNDKMAVQSALIADMSRNLTVLIQIVATQTKLQATFKQREINNRNSDASFRTY